MKTIFTKIKNIDQNKDTRRKTARNIKISQVNSSAYIINSKSANQQVQKFKNILSPIFDIVDAGIFVLNTKGDFIELNAVFCVLYGYKKDELIGKNIQIITKENKIIQLFNNAFVDKNLTHHHTFQSFHKNGDIINITTTTALHLHHDGMYYSINTIKNTEAVSNLQKKTTAGSAITNKESHIDALVLLENNVSHKIKKNEDENHLNKSGKLLRLAEKIAHIGIIEVDDTTNECKWSDGFYSLLGLLPQEIEATKKGYLSYLHPEDLDHFIKSLSSSFTDKIPFNYFETRIIRKDKIEIIISINAYFTFDKHGKPTKFLAILQDITEQKKAEANSMHSQKLLSSAENVAGFGSAEYNLQTKESIWSDGFYKITGAIPSQIFNSPKAFLQFIHPDDIDLYLNWVKNKEREGSISPTMEIRIIRADKEERHALIYGTTLYNDNGIAEKIVGVIQDITESKKIDIELKNSKEKYKALFYDNPSGVFTLNLEGNITSANHIFALKAECTEAALLNMNYAAFVHPEDLAKTLINFENAKNGDSQQIEIKVYTANGNLLEVMIYCLPIIVEQKITGLFCISIDVSEAKNAQIALPKELLARKKILDSSKEFLCELSKDGKFTKASEAGKDFFGYTQKELISRNLREIIGEKENNSLLQYFSDIHLGENYKKNTTLKCHVKNGEVIQLNWDMHWDRINQTIYCIVHETNELKKYPEILDLSEQQNRYLFNSNAQSLFLIDLLNFTIIDVNESALSKYNYTTNEFLDLSLNDFFSSQDATLFYALQTDEDISTQISGNKWMHIKKSGEKVYLKMSGSIVNYKGRRSILIFIDDVTDKINAENAIIESNVTRKLIMNASLDAIICIDINEQITFWNPQAEKIFGWKEDFMMGKVFPDMVIPKRFHQLHKDVMEAYFKTGFCPMLNKLLHVTAVRENEEEFPIELTIIPIKEHLKEFFCVYIRDISEQRKAENQKEFERRDKEALINSTDNFIWSVTKENKLIAGNKPFYEAYNNFNGQEIKPGDPVEEENKLFMELGISWKDLHRKALAGNSFKTELRIPNAQTDAFNYYEIKFTPIYKDEKITGVVCYGNDITEVKLNQNNLIVINTKLKTAQQIASLGYWEINLKNNKIYLSDELYKIFGIETTDPIISIEKMFNLIHPDDRKLTVQNYKLTIKGKQPFNHEHRIVLNDGTVKVVVQKGTIIYNEDGLPITLEGTAQDITYRKNAEKLVKDSEEKYRMIFNSNPSANWIYDLETLNILEVNNAAIAHYGYSMSEFLNMSIDDIFVQKEMAAIIEINREISSYGIMKFGQWHHIKKSGEIINVDITGHAIFYNGKNAVMIVSNDITKILRTQQELAKSIERFEYATKATSDAIWDCDLINNTMFWGEGFNSLFGYKLKEREPGISSLGEFCHPDDKQRILLSVQKVIDDKNQIHWQEEYRFKKFDGTYVTVSDRALVVRDINGDPYRIIGAMQDVTERIQNEKILKQLNGSLNKRAIDLARSNEELEQFAYITSHDLQEPLRMVSSFLIQIQKKYDPQLDETGRLYIRFAVDGAIRMRKIILDLLEYSRVGRQLFQYEHINTTTLLTEVTGIYTQMIEEKKLVITYKNLPDIFAARLPMQQLFQNLIGNAIKYQQPDNVPIIIISGIENEDHWLFSIKDNGIGIDAEYYKKIFVIFQRLHNKDEYSGTGIGLAICKKIIENHNGNIWVESNGNGSTFYFSIPKLMAAQ